MLAAALLLLSATVARAHIAVEPLREILRGASADIRVCAGAHDLPAGRYAVRIVVNPHGKADEVELERAPAALGRAATSCLEAAFARLRFPATAAPDRPPSRVAGTEPASHLPPARRRDAFITVHWPFVLALGP